MTCPSGLSDPFMPRWLPSALGGFVPRTSFCTSICRSATARLPEYGSEQPAPGTYDPQGPKGFQSQGGAVFKYAAVLCA